MRQSAALARRPLGVHARPRVAPWPALAWGAWVKPAALVVSLAFLQLAVTFTAYRCLATEQALRQALSEQSRRVATLNAKVRQVEDEVYGAVNVSSMAAVPDRPLMVRMAADTPAGSRAAALPCRRWPGNQSRCPEYPAPPRDSGSAHQGRR